MTEEFEIISNKINEEGLIALIYARVSSTSQDPRAQEHRCKQYAERKGYLFGEIFQDKFSGGGDFWNRPAMRCLMNYIDAHPENRDKYVVIFDDLKRFARDTEFHIRLRKEFKSKGVKVECLNFNFEDSPVGRFVESISAAHNQMEREENARQVIQKQQARLERGYWCFDAPPGLKYIKDPVHGKILAPDEPKASIVKEALNGFLYDRFPNQVDVQAFLEGKGFYHRKKPKRVHLEQVRRILTQILYAGYIELPIRKLKRLKGQHQGLISLDAYERIQAKLNGTSKTKARKDLHLDFPARGWVLCSECLQPFTASWTTKPRKGYQRAYYRCNHPGCVEKNKSVPKDDLEGALGKVLKKIHAQKETLLLTEAVALDIWNERTANSKQSEVEREKEIENTDKEISLYIERIGKATNEAVLTAYEKKVEELTNKKLLLEERGGKQTLYGGVNFETALKEVLGYIKSPYEIWSNGIFEDKRLVLRMVFEENLVYNRKSGFETAFLSLPVMVFQHSATEKSRLVDLRGVEPRLHPCHGCVIPLYYRPLC